MFGLGTGKSAYPTVYTVVQVKKSSKKDFTSPPSKAQPPSTDSLEPAIDGPPSPERIRAYTEQMKRSSIFGNNSRTSTFSSATSSFRSRDSVTASTDNLSLSRRSSGRSNASSMPSSRGERPESVQIFGRTLFSRRGRRVKGSKDGLDGSPTIALNGDDIISEEGSAKDRYYGQEGASRRGTMTSTTSVPPPQEPRTKQLISGPYNFQHVTHTKGYHLQTLEQRSQKELVSDFKALRASQAPSHGELKGIKAQDLNVENLKGVRERDLHFENFSSEALSAPLPDEASGRPQSRSGRKRGVLRKYVAPPQAQRSITYAKSHDNFRSLPPPRPPRSPLSPTCPVALPARTSSRTASVLFDTFDPLATTTIDRPHTNGGFRKPTPFGIANPPPPPPSWSEQEQYFFDRPVSHAVTTPGDEAWPLTASPSGTFGAELADVQEEEEEAAKRRSRVSVGSGELRMSQSVPALRLRAHSQPDGPETPTVLTTLHRTTAARPPLSPGFQLSEDSWDNAIDYAYEHEAEADCDYQWDRCSVEDDNATIGETPSPMVETPVLDLHLDDDERSVYHGRFRPSLLVPSAFDVPELSPMSQASTTSDPRTPSNFLRPNHVRSPSHASSFKESHGFTLSPTLLIPSDFKAQMEQDTFYDEHFHDQTTSASIFTQEPYSHSFSPVDESISSTASYRSSNFSRGSARSSSSTRMSGTNSRGSQDSMMLLGRAASINQAHRSIGSASSLPDLIPSTLRKAEISQNTDLSQSVGALNLEKTERNTESAPSPEIVVPGAVLGSLQHRRNKSLALEQNARKGTNHFAPPPLVLAENDHVSLSPVAESFADSPGMVSLAHGRKTSAPVLSLSQKEFKGRARAATAGSGIGKKSRGSYMLFPQV
jgi:hypothetical protein